MSPQSGFTQGPNNGTKQHFCNWVLHCRACSDCCNGNLGLKSAKTLGDAFFTNKQWNCANDHCAPLVRQTVSTDSFCPRVQMNIGKQHFSGWLFLSRACCNYWNGLFVLKRADSWKRSIFHKNIWWGQMKIAIVGQKNCLHQVVLPKVWKFSSNSTFAAGLCIVELAQTVAMEIWDWKVQRVWEMHFWWTISESL